MNELDKESLSERDICSKFMLVLCGKLEPQLTTTHAESRSLLESVLRETLTA